MGENNQKIKNILAIDDSALMRRVTSDIINRDSRFEVTDFATNGFEALDIIYKNFQKYDAVVCDINMPKMTGIDVLKTLKKHKLDIKVIMSSTMTLPGAKETILALELGAFDFVTKPSSYMKAVNSDFGANLMKALCVACDLEYNIETKGVTKTELVANEESIKKSEGYEQKSEQFKAEFEAEIKSEQEAYNAKLSKIKSVSSGKAKPVAKKSVTTPVVKNVERFIPDYTMDKLVVIASSTGGPKALAQVIPKLEKNLDAPVIVVQHMPEGYTASLADRLNELSQIKVMEALDGETLSKGVVYIAKGGRHLRVEQKDNKAVLRVYDGEAVGGLKPCADLTIESLNGVKYDETLFVVMTGMGQDGTKGLKSLKKSMNKKIIVQNQETSAVYGMPRAVVNAKLADDIVALEKIAKEINGKTGVRKHGC